MNNLLKILILTIAITVQSQNRDRFTHAIIFEPQHYISVGSWKGDGFNIGASIEYQMPELMYFKAQGFMFPNLNGIDYYDAEGVVGIHRRDADDCFRLFTGIKGGFIYREGFGHAKFGWEGGAEYYLKNGLYFGVQPSFNLRTDGAVWGKDEKNYWQFDFALKFGIWVL